MSDIQPHNTGDSFVSALSEAGPGWPKSGMRIRRYDENSIHTHAQPFNEQNKASGIIFVDIRKVHDHISTT